MEKVSGAGASPSVPPRRTGGAHAHVPAPVGAAALPTARYDAAVADVFPWVAAMLSAVYVVFAVLDPLMYDSAAARVMALVNGVLALVLGWLALRFWRRSVPLALAHPLTAAVGAATAVVSAAHLMIGETAVESANIALIMVAAGAGLLDLRWCVGIMVTCWALWAGAWAIAEPPGEVSSWVAVLATATGLGLMVNRVRRVGIDELTDALEAARAAAVHDSLTGLANRRGLRLLGDELVGLARRSGDAVSASFIDVDGLKRVNDRHGHDLGDQLLVTMADALRDVTRSTDVIARWGGDEFVAVSLGTGLPATELEARLQARLEEISPIPSSLWRPRVSVGRAVLAPWDEGDLISVIESADRDMYVRRTVRRRGVVRSQPTAPEPAPRPTATTPDDVGDGELPSTG